MAVVVPIVGLGRLVGILASSWGTLFIHLYTNPRTPQIGDMLASYTECDAWWYTPQAVASWTPPSYDGNGNDIVTGSTVTFTVAGVSPRTAVYGYFVTDAGGNLLWSEAFAEGPVYLESIGQNLPVTPTFGGRSTN